MPVNLDPIAPIDAATIAAPAPVDVALPIVENKLSTQAVPSPGEVGYTAAHAELSTGDAATNETLNRNFVDADAGIASLRDDINAKLVGFANSVSASLADVGVDMSAQVSEINAKLSTLKDGINAAFTDIRTKEIQQTGEITSAFNARLGSVVSNLNILKTAIEASQDQIVALNDTYATDSELAARVSAINDLLSTLRDTDLGFLAAVDGVIDEVNALPRVIQKKFTVSAASGVRRINCLLDGFGEFVSANDYLLSAQVMGNAQVLAFLGNQSAEGFDISIKSHGVHFVPQPHDASVQPVDVVVTLTHAKRDPLTFNVDTLKGSFVTSGRGTDSNTVGL